MNKSPPTTHKTSKLQATLKTMPQEEKEKFKEEVAQEIGINLNSDRKMTPSERGKLGGDMVRKMARNYPIK